MAARGSDPAAPGADPDVERIRDIIFGPQMHDYDQRFQNLLADVERLQQQVERQRAAHADLEADTARRVQALRAETREDDERLRSELRQAVEKLTAEKVDRLNLGDLLIELGTQLKQGGGGQGVLAGLTQLMQAQPADKAAAR